MTGCLDECPWNELLRFVEQMRFTGSLRLSPAAAPSVQDSSQPVQTQSFGQESLGRPTARPTSDRPTYELWFDAGFLVGAINLGRKRQTNRPGRCRTNSLFWWMQHQGWLGYATAQQLAKCCPAGLPVGLYFRQQGAVSSQQLQQLFQKQIMMALTTVSDWDGAEFQLQSDIALPCDHLTGLKLSAYDAITLYRQRRSAVAASSSTLPSTLSDGVEPEVAGADAAGSEVAGPEVAGPEVAASEIAQTQEADVRLATSPVAVNPMAIA